RARCHPEPSERSRIRHSRAGGNSDLLDSRLRGNDKRAILRCDQNDNARALLRPHPNRTVQTQHAAVEHVVLEDVAYQRCEFIGLTETVRKRDLLDERLPYFIRRRLHHRRLEYSWRNRNDANPMLTKLA